MEAQRDGPDRHSGTVLVVEDDGPTRQRLADALRSGSRYVAQEAANLAEARAWLAAGPLDALLVDLHLPDGHGTELIGETRRLSPGTQIMVISVFGDEESIISAIEEGASGYLLKDALPADIAGSVAQLLDGQAPLSAAAARFIVRRLQGDRTGLPAAPTAPAARLTPRETDILWGIAKGCSYAEIATHLGISRQTVPGYIKTIYRKLQVNRRGEAVFEAVQQGLIRL
ncbi:response regulator [Aureimonas glaciei]|uniref:DNA-binding response regulator n=1 Tax=Aureimonas glaciei TaxID=1776957 RepID=A0A916Y5U8_9HYPH|nr:response regulator transcription factor [Aureimonas glaciei]GGD32303.1 DNA-binding response regulator [Aureimonas glaciei]